MKRMKEWLVVAIPGLSAEKRVAILLVKIPSLVVAVAVEEPAPTVEEPPLLYLQKQSNYYFVFLDFFFAPWVGPRSKLRLV